MESHTITERDQYFYIFSEYALCSEDILIPIPITQLDNISEKYKVESVERVIFGFKIPYIPNQLLLQIGEGISDNERIEQTLQLNLSFVQSLNKWKNTSFSIRYIWQPDKGEIEIFFLSAILNFPKYATKIAQNVAEDLVSTFQSNHLPFSWIQNIDAINNVLSPINKGTIAELRQKEDIVLTHRVEDNFYVVYPYVPKPYATLHQFFRFFTTQKDKCSLNIHIQPTRLDYEEEVVFQQIGQYANYLSDEKIITPFGTLDVQINDPRARLVGQLYFEYIHRLKSSFLFTAQSIAKDSNTANALLHAFASDLLQEQIYFQDKQPTSPAGYEIVSVTNPEEMAAAKRTLQQLSYKSWGSTLANEHLQRIRFLVDIQTTGLLFRFPIALRNGISGIRTEKSLPETENGGISPSLPANYIHLGKYITREIPVGIPIENIIRHTLIAGTNGSGKTITAMQIISELWKKNIPSLIIEPKEKPDYRRLLKCNDQNLAKAINIYTVGNDDLVPFRINPFEILPGVRIENHISMITSCIESSIPTFGAFPAIIHEAVENIYLKAGWSLREKIDEDSQKRFPTMSDFFRELIYVVNEKNWTPLTTQEFKAAVATRIGRWLKGSIGYIINTDRSTSFFHLMKNITILELGSLNADERSLVMMFLIVQLNEYVRTARDTNELSHVTIIEEAHRVMRMQDHIQGIGRESNSDLGGFISEAFSILLSEVRSSGEGIVIVEQVPTRLIKDVIANTNTKIIHDLINPEDKNAVANSMNLDIKILNEKSLKKGQAIYKTSEMGDPIHITVNDFSKTASLPGNLTDEELATILRQRMDQYQRVDIPFQSCKYCTVQCKMRDRVVNTAYQVKTVEIFEKYSYQYEIRGLASSIWILIVGDCRKALKILNLNTNSDALYCFFVHVANFPINSIEAKHFKDAAKI